MISRDHRIVRPSLPSATKHSVHAVIGLRPLAPANRNSHSEHYDTTTAVRVATVRVAQRVPVVK